MAAEAPTLYPVLRYRDARAAIDWLERAFGFKRMMVYPEDGDGPVLHAELAFGTGVIMLGTMGEEDGATGGKPRYNAPYVYVADVDAHHTQAAAAGADVSGAPRDMDYGSREYSARDLEGNEWSFGTYRPSPLG